MDIVDAVRTKFAAMETMEIKGRDDPKVIVSKPNHRAALAASPTLQKDMADIDNK